MPEPSAVATQKASSASELAAEVRSSAHLLTFQRGLYCISVVEAGQNAGTSVFPPSIRVSLPPGFEDRGETTIGGLSGQDWLVSPGHALLVRVTRPQTRLLITTYLPGTDASARPPKIQIQRLGDVASRVPAAPVPTVQPAPPLAPVVQATSQEAAVTAHLQRTGDATEALGDWMGTPGDGRWIEGFSVTPPDGLAPADLEYQAVLGRGWLSPWMSGGEFCGSRGMSLPLLGFRVRLRQGSKAPFTCEYEGAFTDGARIGPVRDGGPCEAASLAPLEAFRLSIVPAGEVGASAVEPMKPRPKRQHR
jgi:hypothetical protein